MTFASPVNGDRLLLTPEKSMEIQRALDSDIVMVFDECTPVAGDAGREARTPWSCRCAGRSARKACSCGIIRMRCSGSCRAGMHRSLRERSLEGLTAIGFDGYAIGGLSVGEPKEDMQRVLAHTAQRLPADKPRYLMGVGTPEDLSKRSPAGSTCSTA